VATVDVSDGRSARAERTRAHVVEALLTLVEEGDLRPTARRVAQRAGVSLRSVYVHFDDLEDLFAEAAQTHLERALEGLEIVDPSVPIDRRLPKVVKQWTTFMERGLPIRRAASLQEPFSPAVAANLQGARHAARLEMHRIFAPELEGLDEETLERRVNELVIVTNSLTWEALRLHQGLDTETARGTVTDLLAAVLGVRS
jgi:TetR/AcrR family transcriptional regulator of autoinduction and epiphytic fitness